MSIHTRFTAMTEPQRNRWLAWANSHDWGGRRPARYDANSGELVTSGSAHNDQRGWHYEQGRHLTPAALRAWAGY